MLGVSDTLIAAPNAFSKRTVIVTGGAGTIGRPLCFALARAGANVVVNDLGTSPHHANKKADSGPAEDVVAELTALGLSAVSSTEDLSKSESASTILQLALKNFGRIDAIINCVGIHPFAAFEDHDEELCRKAFEVNVLGPMQLVRAAWPHFKAQRYGRVVNCTSAGLFGMDKSVAYVASKGAILGFTKSIALEGREFGILANACAPGAYPPMVMAAIDVLPAEQLEWFKATYTPEGNGPVLMALASEACTISGEVLEAGAWTASRMVLGSVKGVAGVRTMEEVLASMGDIMLKGSTVDVFEPKDTGEYVAFKARNL